MDIIYESAILWSIILYCCFLLLCEINKSILILFNESQSKYDKTNDSLNEENDYLKMQLKKTETSLKKYKKESFTSQKKYYELNKKIIKYYHGITIEDNLSETYYDINDDNSGYVFNNFINNDSIPCSPTWFARSDIPTSELNDIEKKAKEMWVNRWHTEFGFRPDSWW